jgi:2-keto-4-pentenoate hydratase/2-oxohepta-3-ene-1,7-dioic acid hydratase in catechol pathway
MFRLLNVDGRAALAHEGSWFDLARLSGDESLADPMTAVARSEELHALASACPATEPDGPIDPTRLGPPVPRPPQVFGIGLNYRDHAAEGGLAAPEAPLTFTKFPSCLAGPTAEIALSGDHVDWEAEIVVAIGRETRSVDVDAAWTSVAGLMLGQDVSDRAVQLAGERPQFSLGKSFPGYGPTGPALVSPDALPDRDDLALWCDVNGERMQSSRTSRMIFSIPTLVAYLSSICTLYPGDLIFTGTPDGVGLARGRFLSPGDVVTTGADGLGELRNVCVEGTGPVAL